MNTEQSSHPLDTVAALTLNHFRNDLDRFASHIADIRDIAEAEALWSALRSIEDVVGAFHCKPRHHRPDSEETEAGRILGILSDMLGNACQLMLQAAEHTTPTTTHEARLKTEMLVTWEAYCGSDALTLAGLAHRLAVEGVKG